MQMINIQNNITNTIEIPLHALIVMVGPSGAGKSTIISDFFNAHEIVSSDAIRQELTGDFRDQQHNNLVFSEFHRRIEMKLSIGERVIADATHLRKKDRIATAQLGAKFHVPVYYLVINRTVKEKNITAGWRKGVPGLIEKHQATFEGQLKDILSGDGMATVVDLRLENAGGDVGETNSGGVYVVNKWNFEDLKNDLIEEGFNGVRVIGDVHGMARDFQDAIDDAQDKNLMILSLGDVVDYGPDTAQCIDIMYRLVINGQGVMIIGNHERKMEKYFIQKREGNIKVQVKGGMKVSIEQFESLEPHKRKMIEDRFMFLMNHSRNHIILDNKYLFTHASATSAMWNMTHCRLVGFHENRAVFGEIDKKNPFNETGFPNRQYNWVDEIPKDKTVFVGHAMLSMDEIIVKNGELGGKAIFLDTGSGKDGNLSYHDIIFKE